MSNHTKKMIAPIVITIIGVLYLVFYLTLIFYIDAPAEIILLLGLGLIAFIGVFVYVLIERIDEIRSGEEDDLSKY
ncbi:hypothetical protein P261_01446 [Lachnospiraceae bacterium TWA4]|nr:hypothetical protein P261_01446 [Lachnospiraceae bacterium TWA4]